MSLKLSPGLNEFKILCCDYFVVTIPKSGHSVELVHGLQNITLNNIKLDTAAEVRWVALLTSEED